MYSISKAIYDVIRISRIMQHMHQPIKTFIYFLYNCIISKDFDYCLTFNADRFSMNFQVLKYAFLFQVDLEDIVDIAIIT